MTIQLLNDWAAIENAIEAWLEGYTPVAAGSTRWARQMMQRPILPYFTAQVIDGESGEGLDEVVYAPTGVSGSLAVGTAGDRRFTLQLEAYSAVPGAAGATDARRLVEQAVAALQNPNCMMLLNAVGLAFRTTLSGIQMQDEQLGDRWERRAQTDLEFGYTLLLADTPTSPSAGGVPYIETITPVDLTTEGT